MGRPRKIENAEILATAREYFLHDGMRVSMDTVARELDVSATALFKRFGSKEHLFVAAVTSSDMPSQWPGEKLRTTPGKGEAREQLQSILEDMRAQMRLTFPLLRTLVFSAVHIDDPQRFNMPTPAEAVAQLSTWLEHAKGAGALVCEDCGTVARILFSTVQFAAMHEAIPFDADVEIIEDEFLRRTLEVIFPSDAT